MSDRLPDGFTERDKRWRRWICLHVHRTMFGLNADEQWELDTLNEEFGTTLPGDKT